jgi:hypothetical protein
VGWAAAPDVEGVKARRRAVYFQALPGGHVDVSEPSELHFYFRDGARKQNTVGMGLFGDPAHLAA